MSSAQRVRLIWLRPRLWDEAAAGEATLIAQRHEDEDPALAKNTDHPRAGCRSWTRRGAICLRQRPQRTHRQCLFCHPAPAEQPQRGHRHGSPHPCRPLGLAHAGALPLPPAAFGDFEALLDPRP